MYMERNRSTSRCRAGVAAFGLFLLATAIPGAAAPQEEGKRIALIVGNDAYSIKPLRNAVNDARAMDKALQSSGFRTILVENASKDQMDDALGGFADSLGPDDVALFFYAGHALQIDNENFLVPVNFKAANGIAQTKTRCFSLTQFFDELKRARARVKIVVLDSCRSNPVAESNSLGSGLAQPTNAGKETYIAFSTGPNQVAADNPDGRNSWFTEALADALSQKGLTIDINEVFNRVRKRVQTETEGRQTPWSTSSLTGNFYFHAPDASSAENDPTLLERWLNDALRREQREDWGGAIELVNQVLSKKPGGSLEQAANAKLPYLIARRDAQAQFDSSDYGKAGELYDRAVQLDPFSIEAAFQGVNSHLLNERFPDAVRLLKAIRIRGTSASIKKADAMLQEIATVYPEAEAELKAGIPQPPAIEEVFSGIQFGTPDWDAARRYLQSSPVGLTRWVNDLIAAAAPPVVVLPIAVAPAVVASSASSQAPTAAPQHGLTAAAINEQIFHVEVISKTETREFDIDDVTQKDKDTLSIRRQGSGRRKTGPASNAAFGFVQFDDNAGDTAVLVDGKPVTEPDRRKLQLPAGKYEIRAVQGGKIVRTQEVEVKPSLTTAIKLKP